MTDRLDAEAAQRIFEQAWEFWVGPEVARREAAGSLPEGFQLYGAQVMFGMSGGAPDVRLNEEVRGVVTAVATRPLDKDETVVIEDLGDISGIVRLEEDADSGHITMLLTSSGWTIAFDFRRNATHMERHAERAARFISAAGRSLDDPADLAVFAENLFAAVELMAKGLLLWMPDEGLLNAKTHGAVRARFNRHRALGNVDPRFADLLNRLDRLRDSARYLRGALDLTKAEADEMVCVAQAMLDVLRAETPEVHRREEGESP